MSNEITPPQWQIDAWHAQAWAMGADIDALFLEAARWGADQELEACCADIHTVHGQHRADWLRSKRRPKPPSLKEQALKALKNIDDACESEGFSRSDDTNTIRRALEALDD